MKVDCAPPIVNEIAIDRCFSLWSTKRMFAPDNLLLGTSSWSGNDWLASFYSGHLKTRHFIEAYGPEIPRRGNRFVEAESAKWDKLIEDKTPERTVWICKLKMIVR